MYRPLYYQSPDMWQAPQGFNGPRFLEEFQLPEEDEQQYDVAKMYQAYLDSRTSPTNAESMNPMLDGASYSSVEQISPAAVTDPFSKGGLYQTQGALDPMITGQPVNYGGYSMYPRRFF